MPPKAPKIKPVFDHESEQINEEQQQVNYEEVVKHLITQMNQTQNPPKPKPKPKRVLTEERKQVLRDQLARGREKSLHLRTMTRKLDAPEFTTTLEHENLPPKPLKPVKVPKAPKIVVPAYSYEKIDELITNIKELTKAQKAKMDKKEKLEKEREEKEREKEKIKLEKEREKEDDNFLLLPIKKPEQKQPVALEQKQPEALTTSAYYVPKRAIRTRKF